MADNSVADEARALLENSADDQLSSIQRLESQRKELCVQRREISRELKNQQQKRRRLMNKARSLTTNDLLSVVVTRASAAKAKAKAKAKASA